MRSIVCALLCLCCVMVLVGCLPTVVPTERDVVLVVADKGGAYTILEDDELPYHRFEMLVTSDPYLAHLVSVYGHTTEAFLATNKRTALANTVSNRPIIVLESDTVGVLRDIRASQGDREYRLELGIGLGPAKSEDMVLASRNLPRAVGLAMLELAGLPHDEDHAAAGEPKLAQPTEANWALREGFAAALEARSAAQNPDNLAMLRTLPEPNANQQRRLDRYALLTKSTYDGEGDPARVPEAVAIIMLRLVGGSSDYYPQRHMLWMTNYDPAEYAEAKVLLAINRMADKRHAGVREFLASYAETFPSERDLVAELERLLD